MEENRSKRSNSPLFLINEPLGGTAELHLRKSNLNFLISITTSIRKQFKSSSWWKFLCWFSDPILVYLDTPWKNSRCRSRTKLAIVEVKMSQTCHLSLVAYLCSFCPIFYMGTHKSNHKYIWNKKAFPEGIKLEAIKADI